MGRVRVSLALLAFAVVVVVGAAAPARSDALVSYYSCSNKPPGSWCDGRANGTFDGLHSWDYNQGYAPGAPSACQGLYKPSTGIWLTGSGCEPDDLATNYYNPQSCACLEANIAHYAAGNMTITGFADTY
jgi:hypothetical protein